MNTVLLSACETVPSSLTLKVHANRNRSDLLALVAHLTDRLAEEIADGIVLSADLGTTADHCDALINEAQDLKHWVQVLESQFTLGDLADLGGGFRERFQATPEEACPLDQEVDRAIS